MLALFGAALLVGSQAGAETELMSETFTNSSPNRDNGDTLDGVPIEVGGGELWSVFGSVGFGSGVATNLAAGASHKASVAFDPNNHPSFDAISLEATVNPTQSNWVGVGFCGLAHVLLEEDARIWVRLHSNGRVVVLAEGYTHTLYYGPTPEPGFIANGNNTVRIRYNREENSVSAWLNGNEINLTQPDLDYFSYTPDIARVGFQVRYPSPYPAAGTLVVDNLKVTGHIPPGEPLIEDTFTNSGDDRAVGDTLEGVFTEVGPQRWKTNNNVIFDEGHVIPVEGVKDAIASVGIEPEEYPEYHVIRMEATINPTGSAWTALLFRSGPLDKIWENRQLIFNLQVNGRVKVLAHDELVYDSIIPDPAFIDGPNRVRIELDRFNRYVAVYLNGTELELDPVYLGYEDPTICFTPDIHWAGIHARHGVGFTEDRPTIDDFRISLRGKVHAVDSFTNASPKREVGDYLNGAPVETAATSLTWSARGNAGFGNGIATNRTAIGHVAGGLPFNPGDHPDHGTFRVEAMVDPSLVNFTCLGFKADPLDLCWTNRQLLMMLRSDGRIEVRGNDTGLLYIDSAPNPAVNLGELNHLVVEYNRLDHSGRAWVNGVELGLNLAPLSGWVPNITSAGFVAYKDTAYNSAGEAKVDDFVVTLADTIPPLVPDPLPSHRYAEAGDTMQFVCGASGGVGSYTYRWQYSADNGAFANLTNTDQITGAYWHTMTITNVQPGTIGQGGNEGFYRCRVKDAQGNQSYSSASELVLLNITPSEDCINKSLAPGTFTNHTFYPNNFDDWVANGPGWTDAGTHALVETSTEDLSITRSAVPIPAESEGVRLVFGGISVGDGDLQGRFCWGPSDCSAYFFADSNRETDIRFGTSWYQGTPVDGYYTRDLTVEFVTDNAIAELQRIDLMQGPHLTLRVAPKLEYNEQVPVAYVQGTTMDLIQKVDNIGCDLTPDPRHDVHRPITFTLCKTSGSECWNGGFVCTDGTPNPDNQDTVEEQIGELDPLNIQFCTLRLPTEADVADPFVSWTLQGRLDYYDNEASPVLQFTVHEYGTPNLKVENLASLDPVEAMVDPGTGLEEIDWVERGVPFKVAFVINSEQWPSSDVPVLLEARSTIPGSSTPSDWTPLLDTQIAQVEERTGVALEVTIGESLLPLGQDLALLDLRIRIDPGNAIGEHDEGDNDLEIASWIAVTSGPLDTALGTQISSLVDDFDTTGPMATFMSDRVSTDMVQGTLRVRYEPDDPASGEVPYLAWSVVSEEPVSGVMVRILQTTNDDAPDLFAGAGGGAFDPALDSPPNLSGSASPYVADDQWHTLIWRKGEEAPFGSYAGLVQVAEVTTSGSSIGGVPCDSGSCQTLVLTLDTDCAYETSCPTSFIDFVRTWTDPASVQVDGLEATGFTYSADGQVYTPIEEGQAVEIAAGAQIFLQAEVTNQGEEITGSVLLEATDASMTYSGGAVEPLSGQLTVSSLGTGEQAFIDLGSHTVAQSAGTVGLTFTLQTSAGEVSVPTAAAQMTVVIPAGCLDPGVHATGEFDDVASDHWAFAYIRRVTLAGIMNGCDSTSLLFCPDQTVSRAEMAMFMERYMRGTGFVPPVPLLRPFEDVPLTSELACWVELAADDLSSGCGGGNYCPDSAVDRAENAVFLLRAREFVAQDASCCPPPACEGLFVDLPCSQSAAPWAEELYALGIVSGCGGGNYCPDQAITRAELAEYLSRLLDSVPACTFQLDLPTDLTEAR